LSSIILIRIKKRFNLLLLFVLAILQERLIVFNDFNCRSVSVLSHHRIKHAADDFYGFTGVFLETFIFLDMPRFREHGSRRADGDPRRRAFDVTGNFSLHDLYFLSTYLYKIE